LLDHLLEHQLAPAYFIHQASTMAFPPSPASSTSSADSRRSFDQSRPQTLEDLVNHFVASKRSLNTQTVLWRANDIVNTARQLLEENAVLSAKNTSIHNIVEQQVDALEAVRRGIDVFDAEITVEFKVQLSRPSICMH
jgi:autophagy-related protein 17